MQPIAVITAPAAGLIYINGRLAGELDNERPLILPVNPHGVLYMEFRPFARRWRSSAHRFSFKGGNLELSGDADACYVIIWPGSIYEIAVTPLTAVPAESEFATMDGMSVAMLRGDASLLRVGQSAIALPDGARLPHAHISVNGAELYIGKAGEDEYVAAFASGDLRPIDSLTARRVEHEEGGMLRAFNIMEDTVGHARMDTYKPSSSALALVASEYMWANGAPQWPQSAESTMLAALEAEFLSLHSEAEAYLAPQLRGQNLLSSLISEYDAAIPLRYSIPDAHPGAALLRRTSPRTAHARAVHFHALPEGGAQGTWQIDWIIPPE